MINKYILTILIMFAELHAVKQIPSYVHLCSRNHPNLNECYIKSFREIYAMLITGELPEMNLRAIDPYTIEKLELNFGTGNSVSFNALVTDITLLGFNNGILDSADINLDRLTFTIDYKLPTLHLEAGYKAYGKVLLLTFNTTGIFTGNFTDIEASGTWQATMYKKNGKDHIKFNETNMKLTIKTMKLNFSNLFPNNDELTDRTNESINNNIDVLYDEVKPIIEETIRTVINDGLNNVYSRFSLDQLYPS